MSSSIPLSVRIPQDDFEWLTALDLKGATTPSDKLRAVIQRYRREHEGAQSYELALDWLRDLVQPFARDIAAYEHRNGERSEIVAAMIEWVPQLMALLASERLDGGDAPARARRVEDMLLQRSTALLSALLRLGVTPLETACDGTAYDGSALDRQLPRLAGLIEAMQAVRRTPPSP